MLSKANFGVPASQWEAAKAEARAIMIERAKQRKTIFYSELVSHLRSLVMEAHDPRLFHLLGEISIAEDSEARGMLTVVVVHKSDGLPGAGFFELAKTLGRDTTDRSKCSMTELKSVHDIWGRNHRSASPQTNP